MKPVVKQAGQRRAFTIVELLTVMSIIVILIGLLVPALNRVKIYALTVKQKAQFHSIEAALELFNNEFEGYPESGALDPQDQLYPGAMKLCEAMMGWDLLGFHTNSIFRSDGAGVGNQVLYDATDLSARRGPFLPLESANAYRLEDLYPSDSPGLGQFNGRNFVLCDVYAKQFHNVKAGMPILYYKANTANFLHLQDINGQEHPPLSPQDAAGNIYNYWDNQHVVQLGKPWVKGSENKNHRLLDYQVFYQNTRSHKIESPWRPYMADRFILISAGYDNEYGTADDVCNYDWKYTEMQPQN